MTDSEPAINKDYEYNLIQEIRKLTTEVESIKNQKMMANADLDSQLILAQQKLTNYLMMATNSHSNLGVSL